MSRRQTALNKQNNLTVSSLPTTHAVIEYTMNSTDWPFDEPTTTPMAEVSLMDNMCKSCQVTLGLIALNSKNVFRKNWTKKQSLKTKQVDGGLTELEDQQHWSIHLKV